METTYHVKTWGVGISPYYVADYPKSCTAPKITPSIDDAAIFSRQGAIVYAREVGGTPVMLTRTGKVRVIHP